MTQAINLARGALSGRKTYIVMALMILNGVYALIFGGTPTFDNPTAVSESEAMRQIFEGLGFGTVRAGIAKVNSA